MERAGHMLQPTLSGGADSFYCQKCGVLSSEPDVYLQCPFDEDINPGWSIIGNLVDGY